MDELIDKIKEIQELALGINGDDSREDEERITAIQHICDKIIIDHQINERLQSKLPDSQARA